MSVNKTGPFPEFTLIWLFRIRQFHWPEFLTYMYLYFWNEEISVTASAEQPVCNFYLKEPGSGWRSTCTLYLGWFIGFWKSVQIMFFYRQSIVQRNPQGFRDEVIRTLVGVVVLTRYNNKTYRIDDIVWDKTPTHSFSTSSGESISFLEYYQWVSFWFIHAYKFHSLTVHVWEIAFTHRRV